MAQGEYEKSRDSVRGITLGFTRQVKRMESEINGIKSEALQARYLANEALNSKKIDSEDISDGLGKVKELSDRVTIIEKSISDMKKEISNLSSQPKGVIPTQNPLSAPIPLQEDAVLQELTGTELEVLKMIVDFDEGTVPEIKEHIQKTREHTARLLKKLYDKGFIDRNTSSMPYRYSIRKEIRDLIMEQSELSTLGF
jgi:hypothetical protein